MCVATAASGNNALVFDYVIVGGGRAGVSAVEGIRELDASGSILLIGAELHLPYDRPPLSKKLWFGKKEIADIFIHERAFFDHNGVELASVEHVTEIRPERRRSSPTGAETSATESCFSPPAERRGACRFPGAELEGVYYFRTLDDYIELSSAPEGKSILVVGGGFIGSEIAAALSTHGAHVTMMFPGRRILERVFPEALADSIQKHYEERGIRILSEDAPVSFAPADGNLTVETRRGERLACDSIVVGVGIEPEIELARCGRARA